MRAARIIALAAALGGAFAACGVSSTTVTLEVTSELACDALKGVDILVTNVDTGAERSTRTTRCQTRGADSRVGSLVIEPGQREDATIEVRVVAGVERPVASCTANDDWAGCIVARRTVQFSPGTNVPVAIALRRSPAADAGVADDAGPVPPDGAPWTASDAGTDGDATVVVPVDGGPLCGVNEKSCGGKCVANDDPQFGCSLAGCSPCPDLAVADYACTSQTCSLVQCKTGFKKCGGGCVAADVAHGCNTASCAPCDASNGTATCTTQGCSLKCANGFKRCGGKCVSIADPTYGCSATSCSATSCPNPGGGTLACVGSACVIGSCPAGTKNCNQKCVPKDVQNGCDGATCSPCAPTNVCSGTPAVCTCVPESAATTCAGKSCGTATNNCGQRVNCPDKCQWPQTCGGGGAGKNACGCTRDPQCQNMTCGAYYDNCGYYVTCGSCTWPEFCGGGGGNVCGAPWQGDCGSNWPSMGTFTCDDQHREHQTICGCHPEGYYDPALWGRYADCYEHLTGRGC